MERCFWGFFKSLQFQSFIKLVKTNIEANRGRKAGKFQGISLRALLVGIRLVLTCLIAKKKDRISEDLRVQEYRPLVAAPVELACANSRLRWSYHPRNTRARACGRAMPNTISCPPAGVLSTDVLEGGGQSHALIGRSARAASSGNLALARCLCVRGGETAVSAVVRSTSLNGCYGQHSGILPRPNRLLLWPSNRRLPSFYAK